MYLPIKVLLLLWLINFAPPALAHYMGKRWDAAFDGGRTFLDGRPLFGDHKTGRGVVSAVAAGLGAGLALGFSWWVGLLCGVLSVVGDLLSSFVKRRLDFPSGSNVPGLDQIFEGLFPFFVLAPQYDLSWKSISVLTALFSVGAYAGSKFYKEFLLVQPFEDYPRPIYSRVRLREWRSCQITSSPLHKFVNFEDAFYYHVLMKGFFRLLRIYDRGMHNALDVKISRMDLAFRDLPPAFEGYTILFLSDLHLDGLPGLTERLDVLVRGLSADLCIIGGDIRMETHGPFTEALSQLCRLIPAIRVRDGILGVLGNHDCIEIVQPLEKVGISYLINDARAIERNGEILWIVGVDDPHYYKCHDLDEAFKQVPSGAFSVFVAHSNEVYREASQHGARFYLCGHSHDGQIQIPPFGPVFTHSKAPRRLCRGVWKHGDMVGYTGRGVGVSGVPLRFFSQGEVALITLRNNKTQGCKPL